MKRTSSTGNQTRLCDIKYCKQSKGRPKLKAPTQKITCSVSCNMYFRSFLYKRHDMEEWEFILHLIY